MSAAALPPIHGAIRPGDNEHPAFAAYQVYRQGCVRLMVEAEGFRDWLAATERNKIEQRAREHRDYPAFKAWMVATQAGGRPCPGGRSFPENFEFWRQGGRW
jgi:hypothetical protein